MRNVKRYMKVLVAYLSQVISHCHVLNRFFLRVIFAFIRVTKKNDNVENRNLMQCYNNNPVTT